MRVKVNGTKLTASLVLPPEGQPCPTGQNYLVILTLGAEYESYQVG